MVSSTNSCALVHPLTEPGSVELAVTNVAERSFFAFAELVDPSAVAELTAHAFPALTSVVCFSGPVKGEMRVTVPDALTRELAQAFSGDPEIALGVDELRDMAGEFTNMVTGAWLTATDVSSTFDLTAPAVEAVTAAPPGAMVMQINGQPIWLSWKVE
ncbi:MAG: chemotaxis protein CheX [Acidobacteria bacterium]|nr:chemotaxis protein CheX [Acidobacteriota bacterium]